MTTKPIGKSPNDGGGDMERARAIARQGLVATVSDTRELLDRLVRRVEEAERDRDVFLKAGKEFEQQSFRANANLGEVLKERDTLKSKLSEAEKALEEAKSELRDYHYEHPTMKMIDKALSRLRADGGGRGEEKA